MDAVESESSADSDDSEDKEAADNSSMLNSREIIAEKIRHRAAKLNVHGYKFVRK